MKITVFAAGSQGDVQPCIALSRGLADAGYHTTLAAPADFSDYIQKFGVDFTPLRGDVRKIMAGETGKKFMESGSANPLKSILAMRKMIAPIVTEMTEDLFAACTTSDALVCLGVFSAFGRSIGEALGIPVINIEPTPLLPTRSFAAPSWPIQKNLGGLHNYISGLAMLRVVWLWYQPFVNQFRARRGLPAMRGGDFLQGLRSTPMVGAYSPSIIPRPPDWPDSLHISGYLFLESRETWQPPPGLEAFLEAGEAPVYIGFGSMTGADPAKLAATAVEALAICGRRGILLTGWGGLRLDSPRENVFILENAPHGWLFPRMAALVHHGGAGTTAEGLRAGVPAVVTPFIVDQRFWGARVKALGTGPAPIPRRSLTAERLAAAIDTALTDAGMKAKAVRIGEAVRAENGLENAVNFIRRHLG
jgi:UDP:flavonoid glycosyltransferase YjiC (YdhE family)